MEQINYKEKYEQALEVAQRFYNNSVAITKKGLEDIFPELKEIEDERIRKRIIDLIKEVVEDDSYHVYRFDEMIAWLEKQGEQGVNGNKREIPNSSWSEEDELQMQGIIDLLPGLTIRHNWLKSLKDRVQPKQEWNEEDQKIWADISDMLWEGYKKTYSKFSWDEIRDWIKPKIESLKVRSQSQSYWKPSEEQMAALKHASNDCSIAFADMKILATLYDQLKALHRYEQDT